MGNVASNAALTLRAPPNDVASNDVPSIGLYILPLPLHICESIFETVHDLSRPKKTMTAM